MARFGFNWREACRGSRAAVARWHRKCVTDFSVSAIPPLQVCGEQHRFEKLMEYFRNEDSNIDFMVSLEPWGLRISWALLHTGSRVGLWVAWLS